MLILLVKARFNTVSNAALTSAYSAGVTVPVSLSLSRENNSSFNALSSAEFLPQEKQVQRLPAQRPGHTLALADGSAFGFAQQEGCSRDQDKRKSAEDPPFVFAQGIGSVDGYTDAAAGLLPGAPPASGRPGVCRALVFARHGSGSGNGELQRLAG